MTERNADVSKTLTEQWEKGALLTGWYWVKMSYQGAIIPLYYSEDYGFEYDDHFYDFEEISEVLGRVPSYEEWQKLKEFADYSIHNRDELTRQLNFWMQENTKLKELLKGAREVLKMVDTYCGNYDSINGFLIVEKINQALGEK